MRETDAHVTPFRSVLGVVGRRPAASRGRWVPHALAVMACAVSLRCGTSPDAQRRPSDAGAGDGARGRTEAGGRDGGPKDAAPPIATTLSTPFPLVPPFSPSIHDYYVRCPAMDNSLVVTMTAAPGSTIALSQPVTTEPSVENIVQISVKANAAIVANVTGEAGSDQYWVRCLPPDFPPLEMTAHSDSGTPTPGYYLVGNVVSSEGEGGYAIALDRNGVPVWYHTTRTGAGAADVDNLIPGVISFAPDLPYTFTGDAGQFELHDLPAGTAKYFETVGVPLDLHEFRYLPNGDYLVLSDPIVTGVDLTGLDQFGADTDMLDCVIQELDPTGALVWQWTASEHFDPVQDCTFSDPEQTVDNVTVADPFHCNSIDLAPNGDLLVSARNMDSIFLVDRATSAVLWKMGGSTYSKDSAQYVSLQDDPMVSFYRQHDARFQPDGTISLFDDQSGMAGPARALVLSYDVPAGTASVVWQYKGEVTSDVMGSFRILADGSRVIGWGLRSAPGPSFSEVDDGGNDLLDFAFLSADVTYRAIKIPATAFDLGLLRRRAGADGG